jgi:hypothetical protein
MLNVEDNSTLRILKKVSGAEIAQLQTPEDWFHYSLLRGRKEIFSEVVELTPAVAELLLKNNNENRAMNEATVQSYTYDITQGRWDFNGESLKIARDGSLNDGQHRCEAVVRAGKPIRTLMTFGLDRSARMTVDQGRVRGVGDYLFMEGGVKNSAEVAAAARIMWSVRNGFISLGTPRLGATKTAIRAEYWAHAKAIDSAVSMINEAAGKKRVLGGKAAAIAALVSMRRAYASADDFMSKFIVGNDLKAGDPILVLRERFMGKQIINGVDRYKMILRAFDHWVEGRTISKIAAHSRKGKR